MQQTIVLCGGGTGGHVYPLVAVADALAELAPHVRLVFVGTERGIETQVVPARGYELELVRIDPIRGRGLLGAVRGVGRACVSLPEALALLRRLRPKAVFSIGGYAAGSVSMAAKMLRIPLALMEPNAVVGLANRCVAPLVNRAYTAWAESEKHFPKRQVRRTGLAIRSGFEPRPYTYDGQMLRVLVLGGSQGARALNEAVPQALAECKFALSVVHQAGKGNDEAVRERYRSVAPNVPVEVTPFINTMADALRDADLVVGRSGAGAIAEICGVGRPAMLIPYPFASGDHQYFNAQALVEGGAAVCVRNDAATPARLAAELAALTAAPDRLKTMAEHATKLGHPHAARVVAKDLLALADMDTYLDEDALVDSDESPEASGPKEIH